jgi:hypothetical protein
VTAELITNLITLLLILTILYRINIMSAQLDDLVTKVDAIETVADSAIALLTGLKTKLDEAIASGNPAALTALSERLGAQAQELADAVTANTPAE